MSNIIDFKKKLKEKDEDENIIEVFDEDIFPCPVCEGLLFMLTIHGPFCDNCDTILEFREEELD
jgi:hypothetical protein